MLPTDFELLIHFGSRNYYIVSHLSRTNLVKHAPQIPLIESCKYGVATQEFVASMDPA